MTLEAVETPVAEPVAVETPEVAEEPTFESGEQYFEAQQPAEVEARPEAPKRRSPLEDPRANQFRQTHRDRTLQRQGSLETAIDELVGYGVPEASARRIVNDHKGMLNAEHSDGIQFAGFEAAALAVEAESQEMRQAFAASLSKTEFAAFEKSMAEVASENNGTVPWADVGRKLLDVARKDYISQADHKKAVIEAFNKGREQRAAVGTAAESKGLPVTRSLPAGSKAPKSRAEAQALHAAGVITNAEYRDYQTKLS